MIRKISNIKNLAVFNDFEWDKSVVNIDNKSIPFQKMNIIYGRNYSGKTTLSRILRALETGTISNKYENPAFTVSFDDGSTVNQNQIFKCNKQIRVFNEDFVRENLRFIGNPEDTIEPFAILGDNNNTLGGEIQDLENAIGIKDVGKETGLYAQLKIDSQVYMEAKRVLEKAESSLDKQLTDKATGRENGIKYKANKFNEPNYSKPKLQTDIQNVLDYTYTPINDDKKEKLEKLLTEQSKATIPALSRVTISWGSICDQTEVLLSRKIGTSDKIVELIQDVVLNEWVKKGCELHDGKRKSCGFCGAIISDNRWESLHAHFDEESKELEKSIEALLLQIEIEKKNVLDGFAIDKNLFYSEYHSQIDLLEKSFSATAKKYSEQLQLIAEQLINRKKNITSTLLFNQPNDISKELSDVWTKYEAIRVQSNEFSNKLNGEQAKARTALRLQEVYSFCKTIDYTAICSTIADLKVRADTSEDALKKTQKIIQDKETNIEEKKRQLNDEEKGAIRVNEFLTNFFGHDFLSLKAVEETDVETKKIRFEIIRNGKRAYHLSEGECSLIAFCYFMAKLDDIETKDTNPIIWIDDPVSSLDSNHIFFVYTLIAIEIADKGNFEQLFISTHNLDFLKYLKRLNGKYLKSDPDVSKGYFIITRKDNESTIQLMPKYMRDYVTEFNYLFQEIYKCSCIETIDDYNFSSFYNFGNNARKFLEIFLFYKYPDSTEEREKMERFFGEGKAPVILTERLNNEYSHLCGNVERASLPIEEPEMLKVAKLIIEKVKEDNDQYTALMNSIGIVIPTNS